MAQQPFTAILIYRVLRKHLNPNIRVSPVKTYRTI
jgi:hypothetical protein